MPQWVSARLPFVASAAVTVALGLTIHWHGAVLGPVLRDVAGDALWAMMIFWLAGTCAPGSSIRIRGAVSLGICVAVETSQLVHTPFLDALRNAPGGNLVLGSGFDPRDIASYTLGVLFAITLEKTTKRRTGK